MRPSIAPRNMCAPWRAHDIPKCPSMLAERFKLPKRFVAHFRQTFIDKHLHRP